MNRLIVALILCVVLPTFACQADMMPSPKSDAIIQLGVIKINGLQIMESKAALNRAEQATLTPDRKSIQFQTMINQIINENKNAGSLKNDPIFNALYKENQNEPVQTGGLITELTPAYKINRNFLSLSKVSSNRRVKSIMFTFLMNKEKVGSEKKHNRVHILWPSRKMLVDREIVDMEQQVIDNQYPIDMSIAKYQDGYANREWNIVLPNKKPREVVVSLLWYF